MIKQPASYQGLIKTEWSEVRDRVAKANPQFAAIVDRLDPGKTFPVFLAYYPYGALIGDEESMFLPTLEGNGFFKLTDATAPKDIDKQLGYGKHTSPMAMVLEKTIEWTTEIPGRELNRTVPRAVYGSGAIFPLSTIFTKPGARVYNPNKIGATTSGARSAFVLPNIGCAINHSWLQRDYNVHQPPAKSSDEHWAIFKEILYNGAVSCDWHSCLLYFSEKWIVKINTDPAWLPLKAYLLELGWHRSEYERNRLHYDIAFSIIKNNRNLRLNPYLADTARHLFTIALGAAPGYAPAVDDSSLPLSLLQQAFVGSYGLKKYWPTILQPAYFSLETDVYPIYYSLQNPSAYIFAPTSRNTSSTLFEMRELAHMNKIFIEELSKNTHVCGGTILEVAANNLQYQYFHNKPDQHRVVHLSGEIPAKDDRYQKLAPAVTAVPEAVFASDAAFVRGCVSITSTLNKPERTSKP